MTEDKKQPFSNNELNVPEHFAELEAFDNDFDTSFDTEVRSVAQHMREQMQPSEELLKKTLAQLEQAASTASEETPVTDALQKAATAEQDAGKAATPPPPIGMPLKLHTQPSASSSSSATHAQTSQKPQSSKRRRNRNIGIFAAAAATVLMAVGVVGIASNLGSTINPASSSTEDTTAESSTINAALSEGEIVTPANYEDIYASLEERVFKQYETRNSSDGFVFDEVIPFASAPSASESGGVAESMDAAAPLASSEMATSASGAGDFSQTNTQVEGVDEADIVKTDGTHIYSLTGNEIVITKAEGAETQELSRIILDSSSMPQDMYVVDDRLVLMEYQYDYSSYYASSPTSLASIYDISNPENPVLIKTFGQNGDLRTSRIVGNTLYMVSVYYVYYYEDVTAEDPQTYVPNLYEGADSAEALIQERGEAMDVADICILPTYSSACYSVVAAIDVEDVARLGQISILGDTNTVYMSQENLFLAATSYGYQEILPLEVEVVEDESTIEDFVLPILPWDVMSFLLDPQGWMERGEADGGSSSTSPSMVMPSSYNPTTQLVRLALNSGYPVLEADTTVDGTLLNQFSLDEYEGYLRVAMTVSEDLYYEDLNGNQVWDGTQTSNSLYIFDKDLSIAGSIEDLAQGERIYSARFTGEVGYMVTFRETDPLFSLDLSDPYNPMVMDALKIPGFSQYLHPYAEGLLLGLGQDTDESGWITGNLKLSMFDTRNPYDLSEVNKMLIEATYSPALYNHKAVLIDSEKDLIGFPLEAEIAHETSDELINWEYTSYYMIFGYDEQGGFYKRATIELPEQYLESRALYIDNYLYVVCGESVGVFDLTTLEEIIWINAS